MTKLQRLALFAAMCIWPHSGGVLLAQVAAPKVVLPPTVEGDWIRTDEAGAGNYQTLTGRYAKASLTAEGEKLLSRLTRPDVPEVDGELNGISFALIQEEVQQQTNTPHKAGQPYVVEPKPCAFRGGFGALEFNSAGLHAVKSKTEFALYDETAGNGRHIYLDGRPLPAAGTRTPTNTGYSVGHAGADGTLDVATVDMTTGVVTGLGVRTPQTVLTQRFVPSADGAKLAITYTWADPALYTKPHTYTHTFERMPADAVAYEEYCDATNARESESITPPEQK